MDNNLHIFLKSHKVFSSLDENDIEKIKSKFKHIDLKYDNILFQHGDAPEAIYLLISGKLSASIINTHNQVTNVGQIDEGEIIGEFAVLANQPYPYTVKAIRNCVLYKLSRKDFLDLCHEHPSCMLEAVQPLISRPNAMIHLLSSNDTHNSIAIFPANKHVIMNIFVDTLIPLLKKNNDIVLLSDYFPENWHSLSIDEIYEKINYIEQHKKSSQQIIYLLKSTDTPLSKAALKKSDHLYLVANALSDPLIDTILMDQIQKNKLDAKSLPNLILTHPSTTQMPKHTSIWLQQTPFKMHHHVKVDVIKHYERLIRFFRNEVNGLVLGGGGTRGWGHIGVIKALCDQEHPIDYIGGTSVGAIIGGCYAMQESYEDTYTRFSKIVSTSKNSISWRSVTLPIVSVFDAKTFTNAGLEVFENVLIEDLWLPYFCISSNLANYSEEIHKTGLLWEKARASSSIPGLIPPMVINGEIHFDGGLLNNLPVDVMWQQIGKKGKVIGVELNSSMHDSHKYHFPPILAFKQAITTKIGIHKEAYKFPKFVDIFLRGLLVGSSAKAKQNGQSATILVNLSLRKFRMLKYSHKQAQKMIEIGFLETTSQIHQYQNRHL